MKLQFSVQTYPKEALRVGDFFLFKAPYKWKSGYYFSIRRLNRIVGGNYIWDSGGGHKGVIPYKNVFCKVSGLVETYGSDLTEERIVNTVKNNSTLQFIRKFPYNADHVYQLYRKAGIGVKKI